ncbi:MAG: hypothetical protein ACR652_08850 [Methylocystis sp.]|uniref:hypothetical protein n=1 Tax=Methylocystis sp. TaxID=1911079 RepID=UPI003DA44F03
MTKLPQDSSASNANNRSAGAVDEVDSNRSGTAEPPLELVLAPNRSDARRRFAYIGALVAAALTIGFLSGSSAGLKRVLGVGVWADRAELAQALPSESKATTDTSDEQKMARLVNAIDALQAQIEQVRHSADNLQASERLRALEAAREQSVEAGKTNTSLIARLDKLETRLAQLERVALDRTPTASFQKPDRSATAKPNDDKRNEIKTSAPDHKSAGALGVIGDYVLERVDGGVAFLIRPDGFMDAVVIGNELPGAGRVTGIERGRGGWIVTTTQGAIVQRP